MPKRPLHVAAPFDIVLGMVPGRPSRRRVLRTYRFMVNGVPHSVEPFEYDGSTIPWPLRWLMGGRFHHGNAQAGAVHDACREGRLLALGLPKWVAADVADALWREVRLSSALPAATFPWTLWLLATSWLGWFGLRCYHPLWGRRGYVTKEEHAAGLRGKRRQRAGAKASHGLY
jgi:hypothetical protein